MKRLPAEVWRAVDVMHVRLGGPTARSYWAASLGLKPTADS